jgi:hypothetical protein
MAAPISAFDAWPVRQIGRENPLATPDFDGIFGT